MNKNIFKLFVGGLAVCGLAFFVAGAKAQEAPHSVKGDVPAIYQIVAMVSVYDPKIASQDENKLKITFDLNNQKGVQPQVKYAVALTRQNDEGASVIVDQKVYDEVLSLNEDETIRKTVEYEAPGYLNGKYQVWVISMNAKALPLARMIAGEVKLNGTNEFLEIFPDSCQLTVEGEVDKTKYEIWQGVDIEQEEQLGATCDVANHFNREVSFMPEFKTYYRSAFGKLVQGIDVLSQPKLSLKSQEKKTFYFILPKASEPQAYDVDLVLVDDSGNTISNSTAFHYVLRGQSATIQNLRLDKDFYRKGDIALATFSWSAAADNFPGARMAPTSLGKINFEAIISGQGGSICSETVNQDAESDFSQVVFGVDILNDCINPKVVALIKNNDGKVLDKSEFFIESKNGYAEKSLNEIKDGDSGISTLSDLMRVVILIVVVAGIGIYVLIYTRKRNNKNIAPLIIFLILLSSVFASGGNKAFALTAKFGYSPSGNFSYDGGTWNVEYNVLKPTYNSNEAMTGVFSQSASACANRQPWRTVYWDVPTRNTVNMGSVHTNSGTTLFSVNGQLAPVAAGNYKTNFNLNFGGGSYAAPTYIDYVYDCNNFSRIEKSSEVLITSCENQEVLENIDWRRRMFNVSSAAYRDSVWQLSHSNGWNFWNSLFKVQYLSGIDYMQLQRNRNLYTFYGGGFGDMSSLDICSKVGDYTIRCLMGKIVGSTGGRVSFDIPFSVTSPPVNGACGSANGGSFATVPNTNLCAVGAPSAVSGTGPWTWTCNGTNGGSPASCSANKANSAPNVTISSPAGDIGVGTNDPVLFAGSATDPDGDSITAYNWWDGGCGIGTLISSAASFTQTSFSAAGTHNINFRAQDSKGAWSSCQARNITVNYQCTGAPTNATLCPGDDNGLPANTSATAVDSCTGPKKCEYQCNNGFYASGNQCVSCASTYTDCDAWGSCNASCWSGSGAKPQQSKICKSTVPAKCSGNITLNQDCNTQLCPSANWQETAP